MLSRTYDILLQNMIKAVTHKDLGVMYVNSGAIPIVAD